MAFWDKLSETVSSKSKEVADKAKEIAEVTSLTSKISTQESLIEKYFKEIGRFVYEHKEEQCDNGLEETFKLVDAAYEEIEKLRKDIRKIKGIKLCESCGAEVASDAAVSADGVGRLVWVAQVFGRKFTAGDWLSFNLWLLWGVLSFGFAFHGVWKLLR